MTDLCPTDKLNDRLTDWLTDRQTGWPTDQMNDRLTDWQIDWSTARPVDCPAGRLTDRPIDWLTDRQILLEQSKRKKKSIFSYLLKNSAAEQVRSDRPPCHFTAHTAKQKQSTVVSLEVLLLEQDTETQIWCSHQNRGWHFASCSSHYYLISTPKWAH
jgi:hypothetical protein